MDLSFGSSPWLLLLSALLAAAAAFWSYRTTIPALEGPRRFLLGALRFLAVAIILFLLFEPIFQQTRTRTVEPVIGVLIDQSESMALADSLLAGDGPGTGDLLSSLSRATSGMQTHLVGFGSRTDDLSSLDSVRFALDRTDLAAALSEMAASLSDRPLAGVILASDGLYNTGANPLHTAERFPVPIFTVALGDSSARRDVRIEGVITNELTYAGLEVPLLVRIRNDGVESGPLQVTLIENGAILSNASATLPPSGSETSVELSFESGEPGRRDLRVVISRYDDEATYRNNEARLDVRVLDQKKSILLLAGGPSPDVSALSRLLSVDDTATLTVRTQKADGTWHEGDFPADLEDFDLILAVGFPGASTRPDEARIVTDAVGSGTPLLYVHDRSSNPIRLQESFGGLLPVQLGTVRSTFIDGTIQQTPAAASHAIFDIDDRRDGSRWRRLPPLSLSESQWEAAAGATVLATSEIRGIALPDPVLAVMRRGQVKTAALTAHGFWRWTLVPEDLEPDAVRFEQLVANLVQWLYATDDDRLVRVEPTESSFAEGDAVILRGEVYDEALRPVSDAALSVQLTSPQGQVFPYEMQPRGNGRYALDIGALPAGTYTYAATAQRDEQDLGTDTGSFSIGRRTLEFRRTQADFDLLRQIAVRSGGVMVMADDPAGLEAAIRGSAGFQPMTESSLEQIRLWQRYPFLIVILLLLSLEWFFRKRWGMV